MKKTASKQLLWHGTDIGLRLNQKTAVSLNDLSEDEEDQQRTESLTGLSSLLLLVLNR